MSKKIVVCLALFPALLFAQSKNANNMVTPSLCSITIVTPKHNERVAHNGKLWTYFTFTVKGTITNLGDNQLCLYQKKNMSEDKFWWRSGSPIRSDSLMNGNEFQIDYATCGGSLNRHDVCFLYVVVQKICPASGQTVPMIDGILCSSEKVQIFPKGLFE